MIKFVPRSQLVITMPPKKTMKAMKVTSSSSKSYTKVLGATMASKDMKTMMKAQRSRKTMKAATAKGESQKAKDESPDKNKSGTDRGKRGSAPRVYQVNDLKDPIGQRTISVVGPTSRFSFSYAGMPVTKMPEQLKDILKIKRPEQLKEIATPRRCR